MITNHLHFTKKPNNKVVYMLDKALQIDMRLLKKYSNNKFGIYYSPIQRDKQGKLKATHRISDGVFHITRVKELNDSLYCLGDIQVTEELILIKLEPDKERPETIDFYVLDIKKPSTDKIEGLLKDADFTNEVLRVQSQNYHYNINSNLYSKIGNQ